MPLAKVTKTNRGFRQVEFKDYYDARCRVTESSIALNDDPGSGALWIGVDDAAPKVMARDAASVGVITKETVGWVPYPVPHQVLLTTSMHMDRPRVAALIKHLQKWLDTGHL